MNKLSIQLRQHTPLIHFQHDQAGATLRGTEVKPKLDRFILTQLGDGNYEKGRETAKNNKWIIGNSAGALDYKLSIQANYSKKYIMATFLSNAKKEEFKKKKLPFIAPAPCFGDNDIYGCMYDRVEVHIFSFKKEVVKEVEKYIVNFFNTENFGFRQSKGFGGFSVSKVNDNDRGNDSKNTIEQLKKKGNLFYKKYNATLKDALKIIHNDYQLLKSGKTYPAYQKSKLAEYFYLQPNALRWEKRNIKIDLKTNHPHIFRTLKCNKTNSKFNRIEGGINIESENFVFARALLGLAEQIEFSTTPNNFKKDKVRIKISDDGRSENKIERFQSPLIFKVFNDTIYIIARDIPDQMYEKEFWFSLRAEKDSGEELNLELFSLKTPQKKDFDLNSFLEKYLPELGWQKL